MTGVAFGLVSGLIFAALAAAFASRFAIGLFAATVDLLLPPWARGLAVGLLIIGCMRRSCMILQWTRQTLSPPSRISQYVGTGS